MGHVVSSDEAAAQHIPAARDASRFSHASLAHVRARTRSTDTGLPHTSPRVRAQADTGATAAYFAFLGGPWCPPPRAQNRRKMRPNDSARKVYLVLGYGSPHPRAHVRRTTPTLAANVKKGIVLARPRQEKTPPIGRDHGPDDLVFACFRHLGEGGTGYHVALRGRKGRASTPRRRAATARSVPSG